MIVFIVGRDSGESWEFVGVFSDRTRAEKACLDGTYFVGPITMNQATPIPIKQWADLYRPKLEGKVL